MKDSILNHFQGNWETFYEKYLPEIQKAGGHEYKVKCPFHEEQNASFCINGETGQYFCHGCGKKGDIFHFYAKVNSLDTRRDFGKILKGISDDFGISWKDRPKAKMVKAYDYTDMEGNLLFQVCRMDPKDFRQRQPNGNGKWVWNLKGIDRVLYRLPEVLKADEVLIVEGEKDADSLATLGFTATTCPMGAGKWQDQYNESLKGKHVVLCPDNDNQGKEHMAQVGASLNGNAASLKLLELPGLPSKGDVSDWVSTFKDKETAAERLAVMIENATPYDPPKKKTLEDIILTPEDFASLNLPGKQTLLHPWLKEDSINLIYGWRGFGKTWLGLSILKAVSSGEPFGPWRVEKPVPCLFLDGEMPAADILERIESLNLRQGNKQPLFIYSDALANQNGIPRAHLAHDSWRQTMKRILVTRKVKLWIIDNLASLASGLDENKKQDWDPINQWLLELRFAGIATIMLHHVNKDGGQRGTSAREDNLDTSIMLKKPSDYTPEDGARFIVHFAKHRIRTAELTLIADTEFKLIENPGEHVWTHSNVRQERKRDVLRFLDEGMEQKSICENLDLSKGYVSKIISKAKKDKLLSKKGKLTPDGFNFVKGH